jgi:hypothetical protein
LSLPGQSRASDALAEADELVDVVLPRPVVVELNEMTLDELTLNEDVVSELVVDELDEEELTVEELGVAELDVELDDELADDGELLDDAVAVDVDELVEEETLDVVGAYTKPLLGSVQR